MTALDGPPTDPATMKYEEARDELTQIVAALEAGTESLDASLTLWERGEALAKRCAQWLDSAQERLDGIESESESDDKPSQDHAEESPETPEPAKNPEAPKPQSGGRDATKGAAKTPPAEPQQPTLRPVPSSPPPPRAPQPGNPADPPW